MEKIIHVAGASGFCSQCKEPLVSGGYLVLDGDGAVQAQLCQDCRAVEEITAQKKKQSVNVYKLGGLFKTYYIVTSCKNVFISGQVLTEEEVKRMVENPNIEVTIKY